MERVPSSQSDGHVDVNDRNRAHPGRDSDRAHPGDVLGIERDGETTELGDTGGDEDRRREDAERSAQKDRA